MSSMASLNLVLFKTNRSSIYLMVLLHFLAINILLSLKLRVYWYMVSSHIFQMLSDYLSLIINHMFIRACNSYEWECNSFIS